MVPLKGVLRGTVSCLISCRFGRQVVHFPIDEASTLVVKEGVSLVAKEVRAFIPTSNVKVRPHRAGE